MDNVKQASLLSLEQLQDSEKKQAEALREQPVKVLQFGEGNFLRGFADWMLQHSFKQGHFRGTVAVTQPRPTGRMKLERLRSQDGLYTLLTRGIQNGEQVDQQEVISVISRMIDPYEEWNDFLALAEHPELDIIISNTTEAGLTYTPTPYSLNEPMLSFPAKLTLLMYCRYQFFEGAGDKGWMLLPCELIERNGERLQEIVLMHARDWKLEEGFIAWVQEHNLFLNSLVDRIVPGAPSDAASWQAQLGYQDQMLNTAEPYHLWVIQGPASLDERLPLQRAGLNVHWVEDLAPYQLRKVRLLNGTHTLMASIGLVHGCQSVREIAEHAEWGAEARKAMLEEMVPAVPLPAQEMQVYASEVWERFLNPFVEHRLGDICLNSMSKFRVRLLPTLKAYHEQFEKLPEKVVKALACLIFLYDAQEQDGGWSGRTLDGARVKLSDDEGALRFMQSSWDEYRNGAVSRSGLIQRILGNEELWGEDLNEISGLPEAVWAELEELELSQS
ncbi:tagaturonate reductase [Paenibacillus sp. F411]|uniref:tagaturonate reductase n=1 Tax=Paenibacillus sp. F411 TaxID=2820239 RepID=UPI001AAED032|nr:tagaturonate reductase [Paenibacillus sp. F411]MBO2944133.1 tagaturonate reductase [Paenibacillus sp. F411]